MACRVARPRCSVWWLGYGILSGTGAPRSCELSSVCGMLLRTLNPVESQPTRHELSVRAALCWRRERRGMPRKLRRARDRLARSTVIYRYDSYSVLAQLPTIWRSLARGARPIGIYGRAMTRGQAMINHPSGVDEQSDCSFVQSIRLRLPGGALGCALNEVHAVTLTVHISIRPRTHISHTECMPTLLVLHGGTISWFDCSIG